MSRKVFLVLFISMFAAVSVFADHDFTELDIQVPVFRTVTFFAAAVPGGAESSIPQTISNNEFYVESLRLTRLAQETFEYGDYDASANFAEEAIRYAQLSDEYVSVQLIAEAKRLLDWADANDIQTSHANDYNESKGFYDVSLIAYANEEWDESIANAINSIEILARLESGRITMGGEPAAGLPRQYTVRTWANEKDCLWNIAAYPWVYGDPWRWRELYNANRSRMPDPNNPDLIEPGFVLEIPSIRGEARQGMWDPRSSR
ncbi:MAG: LysM peptidoglycan-binding domain-containing protein [Treponema sp.]|nr:LysM peptidoglycan-binding domain-containing protein [Treponema sp.]